MEMLSKPSVVGTSKAKGKWRNMGGQFGVVSIDEQTEQKSGAEMQGKGEMSSRELEAVSQFQRERQFRLI